MSISESPDLTEEEKLDWSLPGFDESQLPRNDGPRIVILYNDDHHAMHDVIAQVQKATGYDIERCVEITLEAHLQGRSVAYTGTEKECERAARILRQIRLQVETDRA